MELLQIGALQSYLRLSCEVPLMEI